MEKLLLKLNLILETPWSWGCIIWDIMVFLVNWLGVSELLLTLHGWLCFCIIYVPDSIHCKCWLWMWGSSDCVPLVTLTKAHLQYCCEHEGHVIQDWTPSPSWFHCQMWAMKGGTFGISDFWSASLTLPQMLIATVRRSCREISFGAASTHHWCCPLSTKSSFSEVD